MCQKTSVEVREAAHSPREPQRICRGVQVPRQGVQRTGTPPQHSRPPTQPGSTRGLTATPPALRSSWDEFWLPAAQVLRQSHLGCSRMPLQPVLCPSGRIPGRFYEERGDSAAAKATSAPGQPSPQVLCCGKHNPHTPLGKTASPGPARPAPRLQTEGQGNPRQKEPVISQHESAAWTQHKCSGIRRWSKAAQSLTL